VYRSILVPLDGSTFGEHALPLAVSIARRSGASLQVLHVHVTLAPVYEGTQLTFDSRIDDALVQGEQTYLDGVVERIQRASGLRVTSALREGGVPEVIQEQVAARGADLVVMTTHGRGHLARFWLGSVADELIRRLPAPILLVRPGDALADLAGGAVLKHILIPLDGSNLAEGIIDPAVTLGTLMGADYTLLRVIRPLVIGQYDPAYPAMSGLDQTLLQRLQELHTQERKEAETYLERMAAGLRARHLRVETRVVSQEQTAATILGQGREDGTDLVALETHGRSGLPRLFLGSIADKVIRASPLPVLIHRSAGK
jgi:nucleotide-binding universal stress UspA family protein